MGASTTPYGTGARAGFVLAFTGGYDPLPPGLEIALWMTFDSVWGSQPGWGLPAGLSSDAPVKSFGIDGMSISYDTQSGSKYGKAEAVGLLPANAVGILDSYRAESAAIGG